MTAEQTDRTGKSDPDRENMANEKEQQANDRTDATTKKGIWTKYTERLKKTHCTRTPPECT